MQIKTKNKNQTKPNLHIMPVLLVGQVMTQLWSKREKWEHLGETSRTQLGATYTFHFYSLSFSSCPKKGEDGWNSSSHLENRMMEGLLEA